MTSLSSMAFAAPLETINAIDPKGEKPQGKVIDREGKIHCFQYHPALLCPTFSPGQTFAPFKSTFVLGQVLLTPPPRREGVSFLCEAAPVKEKAHPLSEVVLNLI